MKNFLISLALLLQPNFSKDETRKSYYEDLIHSKSDSGVKNAVNSSLVIHSIGITGQLAMGSGNLLKIHGNEVVLTAYHVVKGGISFAAAEKDNSLTELSLIYFDENKDIAVLKPKSKLLITSAIKVKLKEDNLVGKEVYHCGHPSVIKFNLSRGIITSYSWGFLIIDSFSLPGSSGSVVFGPDGDVVGVVVAMATGYWSDPPELIDKVILISPISEDDILKITKSIKENK